MARSRPYPIRTILLVAAALVWGSAIEATRIRPLNLEQLSERSARIFSGRCVKVETAHRAEIGRPVALYTFEVDRDLKGANGERVVLESLGGRTAGLPRFVEGEEVVLFLYGESRLGLSSPVGLGQGKFTVERDKAGQARAINQRGNEGLFDGLSGRAESRLLALPSVERTEKAVSRDALLQMVELLQSE